MSSTVPGGGDTSLGGMKKSPSVPQPKPKPWYANRQWWKQFSVWFSILLSATSLILGSIGEFQVLASETQKALNVSGLVINAVSVILSALTSLDWKSAAQIEADLLGHLDSLLVQQPVLAETPSAPGSGGASEKPQTHTVQVLKLNRPSEEGGSGHPLLHPLINPLINSSSSPKNTTKNSSSTKRRRRFGRNGNSVRNGSEGVIGIGGDGDDREKRDSGGVVI